MKNLRWIILIFFVVGAILQWGIDLSFAEEIKNVIIINTDEGTLHKLMNYTPKTKKEVFIGVAICVLLGLAVDANFQEAMFGEI